jgi:CheY-like chemotaxis protein
VDDNRDLATSLARLLRLLGHEVNIVLDGDEAVAAARSFSPHLVLLDIALAGTDGYRVARALRDEGFQQTIIAAVSGYGMEEDRRRSIEAGMDYHLTKPIGIRTITSLLAKSVDRG